MLIHPYYGWPMQDGGRAASGVPVWGAWNNAYYNWTGPGWAYAARYGSYPYAYPAAWTAPQLSVGPAYAWHYDSRFLARPVQAMMLYPVPVMTADGTQWGYINDRGAMFIKPQFDYAYDFQKNGLAVVETHGKNGIIRLSGDYLVKPIYQYIGEFSEGRAAVIDDQGGYHIMDEAGHILTTRSYSYIGTFHEGRVVFSQTNAQGTTTYGYMDLQGHIVVSPVLQNGNDFQNGKALVQVKDNEFALIGLDGRRLATYHYPFVGPLGDGMLAFQQDTAGKYGYLNEQGKVVIAPKFSMALPFEKGRAIVNTSNDYTNKFGLIDRNGRYVIDPQYNTIDSLGDQRLSLGQAIDPEQPYIGSRYALADLSSGKPLTDFKYNNIASFQHGMASVDDGKATYFIDRQGHVAPHTPKVSGSGTLSWVGSLIKANVDQRIAYYDRWGKLVWQPNTVIPLTPPMRVKEEKYEPNRNYLVYYPQLEGMANTKAQRSVNQKLKELSLVKPIPGDVQLEYSYTGDFEVTFYKENLLVLQLSGYNMPFGAAHGMPTMIYVHINLKTGELYELKDLFKKDSDYVKVLSEIVGKMIKTDPQYSYVFPDSYKGISPDQPFFVTEDALHLYFAPYDIGPYAAGFPTFTIPFMEINGILNKEGSFWRSFH